jgi:tripartite ATP-independent transporter DctM subunit
MYAGAFFPGIGLALLYGVYVLIVTIVNPRAAPALPPEAITIREDDGKVGYASVAVVVALDVAAGWYLSGRMQGIWAAASAGLGVYVLTLADNKLGLNVLSRLAQRVVMVMMPPLALIFLVLGTIFLGIATPTEGGAMGATGALALAFANRRLSWSLLRQAMDTTAKLSSFVMFILIGSTVFTLVFRGVNGDLWVEGLLTSLPGGQIGFLIVVNLLTFFLAFFLDFFELAFIVVPLLGPVAQKLGIDLIWFGVLLGVNMQTSFMHPPFGFALFYLRGVAPKEDFLDRVSGKLTPKVTTGQIYWGAVPFVCIQVIMVAMIITFPNLVLSGVDRGTGIDPNKVQINIPQINYGDEAPIDIK